MNLRKHLAGFAIFSVILGSAIFINHFLTIPNVTIPFAPFRLPVAKTIDESQPVYYYQARLVSLDFINKQSYTALSIQRQPGQPVPQKLWVRTDYFSPDYAPGRSWTSQTEISQPFAQSERFEYVATASCDWCSSSDTPKAGYFAHVYVFADYDGTAYPPDSQFNGDITTAVPVVVQAERKTVPKIVR